MASAPLLLVWPRGNGRLEPLRRPGPLIGTRAVRSLCKDMPGESPSGDETDTDARDATIIADQARVRRDLRPMARRDAVARDLYILTTRRADMGADRTRE